jgi:hypothetical protein
MKNYRAIVGVTIETLEQVNGIRKEQEKLYHQLKQLAYDAFNQNGKLRLDFDNVISDGYGLYEVRGITDTGIIFYDGNFEEINSLTNEVSIEVLILINQQIAEALHEAQ